MAKWLWRKFDDQGASTGEKYAAAYRSLGSQSGSGWYGDLYLVLDHVGAATEPT
jgi:hypothetical protein